ncbi:hypothetical protein L9F63_000679, partial [Diploptera punctata]
DRMDEADRATITHNLVELINQTNLDLILPNLLQRGVFNPIMADKYRDGNTPLIERKRDLFLDLQRRGPHAFTHLLASLLDTGHHDLVRLLKPGFDIEQHIINTQHGFHQNGAEEIRLPGLEQDQVNNLGSRLENLGLQHDFVSLGKTPLTVHVTRATRRKDIETPDGPHIYPMGSKPRGYFFMINNVHFVFFVTILT